MGQLSIRRISTSAVVLLLGTLANAQVASAFTTSDEEWKVIGDNQSAQRINLGNPGGCYEIDDFATGQHNYAIAPAAFLGNWSAFTNADTLAVDLYFVNTSGGTRSDQTNFFRIAGPGGAANCIPVATNYPPQGVWTTYQVTLNPSAWVLESGTWAGLLAAVTSLRISVEYVNGDELVRIDNPRISRTPVPVFLPNLTTTFDSDLGDWSFHGTGGTTFVADVGNSGGCARAVAPAAGGAVARAPAGYLGNWLPLDGIGHIGMDLRLAAQVGALQPTASLVRLSGPGGVAIRQVTAVDLPVGVRTWKRFRLPIRAQDWMVLSGSWTALLANVTECRVALDLAVGGATVMIDNFQRALDTQPDPDEPVVVHVADVARQGWTGMFGASSVARDPLTNEVHVLVDETPANGGGMWQLAGLRLWALDRPSGLMFDPDGNAFASEDYPGTVRRRDRQGIESVWVSGFLAGDDDPFGLAIAPAGFLGTNVSPGDVLLTDRGVGGPDSVFAFSRHVAEGERRLFAPVNAMDLRDVTAFSDGRVFLVDADASGQLLQLLPTGNVVPLMQTPPLTTPVSIVADDVTGMLYVVDESTSTLHRVNPSNGITTLVATGFRSLAPADSALDIDVRGRHIWVVDRGGNRVYRFGLPAATQAPIVTQFGQECGAIQFSVSTLADSSAWLGETLGVEAAGFSAPALGWLCVGLVSIQPPLDLGILGMNGCTGLVSLDALVPVSVAGSAALVTLPIPNTPQFAGIDLFLQALGTAAAANPLGLVSSRALQVRIGIK